jgi:large subunit ribosomal protein L9
MEIILKSDLHGLGRRDEIVRVADGYARNFLIPKGLAVPATPPNLKALDEEKRRATAKAEKELRSAQMLADKIRATSLTFEMETSEDGKLFGSITKEDIVRAIEEKGIRIHKRQVDLDKPLKRLDVYNVKITLHPDVTSILKVWVIKKGSEQDGSVS